MKVLIWATLIVVSFAGIYAFHAKMLGCGLFSMDCILLAPYVFHICFALAVIILFKSLARMPKMKDQLGFVYLGVLLLKLFLFAAFFRFQIFDETLSNNISTANYLVPVFLGLLFEVAFLSVVLKNIEPKS